MKDILNPPGSSIHGSDTEHSLQTLFRIKAMQKPTANPAHHGGHGGRRRRSRALLSPGTSEQFKPLAHLSISNPSQALATLSLDFHIALKNKTLFSNISRVSNTSSLQSCLHIYPLPSWPPKRVGPDRAKIYTGTNDSGGTIE